MTTEVADRSAPPDEGGHPLGDLPTNLATISEGVAGRVGPHPVRAAVAVAVAGYAAVVTIMIGLGLLLTGVVLHTSVGAWDVDSTRWLSHHRSHLFNTVSEVLSKSADTFGVIAIALVVVLVLATRRRWAYVAILLSGLAMELAAFLAVNFVVDRPRPAVAKLGSTPSTSSFPSGHTAATLVLYGAIAVFVLIETRAVWGRALALIVAVLMPVAVGFARAYRGMHHPLDVACGIVMGLLVLTVACVAIATAQASRARMT